MNTTKTRTSKGRQKIEIKKIEKVSSRLVSRSKRFKSVFNKAAELCVLTGAEIAVIVKYPGGRTTHAFGHPSVNAVTERYLCGGIGGDSLDLAVTEGFVKGYQERYEEVEKELEAEKRRSQMIAESNAANNWFWWNEPIDGLGIEDLEAYAEALEELKKKVNVRAEEMIMKDSNLISFSSMLANNNT